MIERGLIYIKQNLRFVWWLIERINALVFDIIFKARMERVLPGVFKEFTMPPFIFRKLDDNDSVSLFELIENQNKSDLEYFKPHEFDYESIKEQFRKKAFLMMGVFDKQKMVGYFFLRFFANRRCFVGRLIDKDYRGRDIGLVMNNIMYETAWRMKFRCLSTISKNNAAIMKAHSKNQKMCILKNLQNEYLLVEFKMHKSLDTKRDFHEPKL